MLNGFIQAAEQKVTYDIVPGHKVVTFNTLNGADDDYVMKFTVTGRWAEINISSSLGWSGQSGQSPRRISACSGDPEPSSETYTFMQGDLGSWNMFGDGWHGPTAECGGDGETGSPPSFLVTIGEDDRDFDVRAVGNTYALVGERLQLHGVVFYPENEQNIVAVESDWDDPPSNTSLHDAADGGNELTGENLKNHTNVFAEATDAGSYTFEASPTAEPDGDKSGSETLKFHSVYLGIEGVQDGDKEDPGGYLGVGAENLQRINLSLDPDHMEASDVTLKVEEGSGIVRIWENADGTGTVISETQSQKTWNYGTPVPASLYVEALSDSTETEVNLELAYDGSGENESGVDRVMLNLVSVQIVEDSTTKYNFSPSLSEKSKIRVNINPPPPEGGMDGFHFKLQIVRETKSGNDQPIEWINVSDDPNSASEVRDVNFDSELFTWKGKPGEIFGTSAAAAEGPDEFTGVSGSFHRHLPAVTLNQCVPPPIYTVVARILKNSDFSVIAEDRRHIYVPQVVKMVYDADAVTLLRSEYTNSDGTILFFEELSVADWNNLRQKIPIDVKAYFGSSINIRVVDSAVDPQPPYATMRLKNMLSNSLGSAIIDFPNTNPHDVGTLYAPSYRHEISGAYFMDPTISLPVLPSELRFALAKVSAHEIGHLLGLVEIGDVLDGTSGRHNKPPHVPKENMNPGTDSWEAYFGRDGDWSWRNLNKLYLEFILPVN